ncbi:MAG: hypothetical protein ACLFQ7_12810 [Phormidium sp.]|nr:MAG: hypothetical protein HLUCCO16_15135 [Phormidium sp. OSCR]
MPDYDPTGLLVGSEGTLEIAMEITLQLLQTPESIAAILVHHIYSAKSLRGALKSSAILILPSIQPNNFLRLIFYL